MHYLQLIGLALGGGVARGPIHIGVIAALEKANIPIHCIAGTSAGALIGSLYCAGMPIEELKAKGGILNWFDIARPVWSTTGFLSFARLEYLITTWIGNVNFDDLSIPFAAVATDVKRGEAVVLKEGHVARAVRASCSVPGFITPVEINGQFLGDGGVSNNLPVLAARQLGADYVIGVDLFHSKGNLRWGLFSILSNVAETMVRKSGNGFAIADYFISPDLSDYSYISLAKRAELIEVGEQVVMKHLHAIRESYDKFQVN